MKGQLYVVATPIGNLEDITLRALRLLKNVSAIYCEDTRHTKLALTHWQINKPCFSLHQHSADTKFMEVIGYLERGQDVAYVTDAGTPGISDPGGRLVEAVIAANLTVTPIPGPSAVITALSASGLPSDRFLFLGFPPLKGRENFWKKVLAREEMFVFYESPHRLVKALQELIKLAAGTRTCVVARELTKKFETFYRGTVAEVLEKLPVVIKGEIVVIIK